MLRFYYHEFQDVIKSRSKEKKCSGLSKHWHNDEAWNC